AEGVNTCGCARRSAPGALARTRDPVPMTALSVCPGCLGTGQRPQPLASADAALHDKPSTGDPTPESSIVPGHDVGARGARGSVRSHPECGRQGETRIMSHKIQKRARRAARAARATAVPLPIIFCCATAAAQQTPIGAPQSQDLQEVVVTGYRASVQSA